MSTPKPSDGSHQPGEGTMLGIEDRTAGACKALSEHFHEHLALVRALTDFFDRELVSAAIAELSEHLTAKIAQASRVKRQTKGYDLIDRHGQRIEVKARISSLYGKSTQYNFSKGSANANVAYCLSWLFEDKRVVLDRVYVAQMSVIEEIGRKSRGYFARTNLGDLEKFLQKRLA